MNIENAKQEAECLLADYRPLAEDIAEKNFYRILEAFREVRVSATHFNSATGYGYNDEGRDRFEELYAVAFGTEAALVRQQIVSGTHAISLALFGNLLPGDELLTVGLPYDTLQTVIGLQGNEPGNLKELGVNCRVVEIDFDNIDPQAVVAAIGPKTRMVSIQRSRGYAWRKSLSVEQIAIITKAVKQAYPQVIVFVDNCYGEMVDHLEPSHFGADIVAGSLIKNLSAGLLPGGGYIVGKESLVERAACRLTVPGAGREMGASLISNRHYFQSLFMAPQIVKEAVLGSVYACAFLEALGCKVSPGTKEIRHDIVYAIEVGEPNKLAAWCRGIQKYSPIDSYVRPEPWDMPGYDSPVIMAGGSFVQGSTIELSADAPMREPYILYMQGGLNLNHVKYALIKTAEDMQKEGLL